MTKRFNKKIMNNKPAPAAKITVQEQIEHTKNAIMDQLSGSNIARLNNLNWIRHEITTNEPKTLFQKPIPEQVNFFDYSCSKGLGTAYDYIIDKQNNNIESSGIRDLHYLICRETNIPAGIYRKSQKILDISINGVRIHAPDEHMVPSLMEEIIYDFKNSSKPQAMRAFDLHYNLISLQAFEDYNKRTARMAMNWALVLSGYLPMVFNRKSDKENYSKAIKYMAMGDSKSYYKYMYDAMKHSLNQIMNQIQHSQIR